MPTLLDLIQLEMDIHMYLCELNELEELEDRVDKAIEMFECIDEGIEKHYSLNILLRQEATKAFVKVISDKGIHMLSQEEEGLFDTCPLKQRKVFVNTINKTLETIKKISSEPTETISTTN